MPKDNSIKSILMDNPALAEELEEKIKEVDSAE